MTTKKELIEEICAKSAYFKARKNNLNLNFTKEQLEGLKKTFKLGGE